MDPLVDPRDPYPGAAGVLHAAWVYVTGGRARREHPCFTNSRRSCRQHELSADQTDASSAAYESRAWYAEPTAVSCLPRHASSTFTTCARWTWGCSADKSSPMGLRLILLQAVNATFGLLRETFREWWGDNALRLGAALAYYAVFSLAPLLIVAIAIAGLVFEHQQAHSQIVAEISRLVGRDGAEAISRMIQDAITPASGILAGGLSVGVIVLGASGAFAELQQGLNDIWKVPPRPDRGALGVIRERGASFFMVLVVSVLFLLSLVLNAAVAALDRWFADHAILNGLLKPMHLFISCGMGTLLFAMIFKCVPDVRIAWRDVWISAVVTSLLFLIGQWVIALYLAHSAVASAFGAAGSLVIILIWVYYSSQILFFGAELTKVYARTCGSLAPALGATSGTTDVALLQPVADRGAGNSH